MKRILNSSIKTASFTLTANDSGKVFLINAADVVATLPATALGLVFTFIVIGLSTTTGFSVSPNAADKIMGGGLTAADDKDVINTAATDAVGDLLEVTGDGADGWYIKQKTGTWARET